jgi:hypothetical protein
LVQLYFERSGVKPPDPSSLDPLDQRGVSTITAQTTLRTKPGEPMLITAGPSSSTAASQTFIVILLGVS